MSENSHQSQTSARKANPWKYVAAILAAIVIASGVLIWVFWPSPGSVSLEKYDPVGDTESVKPFVFSRDIVSPEQLNQLAVIKEIVFTPAVKGKYRWISTRELQFFPEEKLLPATKYSVSNFSQLATKLGFIWRGRDNIDFQTPLLEVYDEIPIDVIRDRTNPEQAYLTCEIRFNFEVDPEDLKTHLEIKRKTGGEIAYDVVQLRPSKTLSVSTEMFESTKPEDLITLTINTGLKPLGGTIPMARTVKRSITLEGELKLIVQGLFSHHEGRQNIIKIKFNHAVAHEAAGAYIAVEPDIGEHELQSDGSYLLIRSSTISHGKTYTITVQEGLIAQNGAALKKPFSGKVKIEDLKPNLHFGATGMFLLRGGNQNLKLLSTNIEEFDVEVSRVYHNNLVPWLHDLAGHALRYGITGRGIENLGNVLTKEKIKTHGKQNEEVVHILNVEDFVKDEQGIYQFIGSSSATRWQRASQWVVLTDLGMRAKLAADELWVWVHSLATTKPVSGVRVEFISRNNQVLLAGSTDSDGKVRLQNYRAAVAGFTPYVIVARQDDDISFVRIEGHKLSDVEFDISGRPFIDTGYEAFLYSERGLYRPGDKAHIVAVVRGADRLSLPDPFPVRFVIKAPDKSVFTEQEKRLNEQSATEITLTIPDYVRTGVYQIELHLGDRKIGQTQVQVEAFMPDRIKVTLKTEQDRYLIGEELCGRAIGQMLFGPPASQKDVEVKYKLEPRLFKILEYNTFTFSAVDRTYPSKTIEVIKGKLDDEGEISFATTLEEELKPPSAMRGVVSATVKESGGRAVSAYKVVNIDPYTHYVGIRRATERPQGGQKVEYDLIDLNRDGKVTAGRELKVELSRIRYHWNYILRDGKYKWVSEKQKVRISSELITSGDTPVRLALPTGDWGQHVIEVTDVASGMKSSEKFWVSGWGSQPWNVEKPEKLDITLDKPEYQIGDRAEVVIKSPFPGRLILTYEANRILASESYNMTENTITIPVKITDDYIPNIYISASVIRSPVGLMEHERARAYGIAPLIVNAPENKLLVQLKAVDEMRPKQKLKVDYRVTNADNSTFLTIAAVDEGILQLIDFNTPDPFRFFYGKRGLGVNTYDMYAELLPEFADLSPTQKSGGDAALAVRGKKYLSTSAIQRVKPVVMWSGLVEADAEGKGTVEFDVPQFNGQLRLMAVAFSDNRFGHASESVVVRDPIVLTATFPRFIGGSDKFTIPIEVFNGTGRDGTFTVALVFGEGVEIKGATEQSIFIKDKQQGFIEYSLTAPVGLKPLQATLTAEGNGERVAQVTDIPLRPPYPVHTIINYLVAKPGRKADFQFPEDWYPGSENYHLHVSGIPQLQYSGSLQYLLEYPYGCAEQTVSRLFPLLYFDNLALELDPTLFESGSVDYFMNEGIQKLANLQSGEGYFDFWPRARYHIPWISLYVSHFLVEARKAGYEIPNRVYTRAIKWCQSVAVASSSKAEDRKQYLRNRVYANYIVAKAGKPNRNAVNYLKNFVVTELPPYSRYQLAAIYAELGDKETAWTLIPKSARIPRLDERKRFHSPTRAKAIMLDALTDIDMEHPQIPVLIKELNTGLGNRGRWYNTQENAYALLALGKYLNRQGPSIQPEGQIKISGEQVVPVTGEELHLESDDWGGKKVVIEVEKGGPAFAYWIASGIPTRDLVVPEDQGMSVRREFYSEEGTLIRSNEFIHGELVVVKITAKTLGEHIDDVIILDMLPAGFEVENIRLSSRQQVGWLDGVVQDAPQYIDQRDDRIILATVLSDRPIRRRSVRRNRRQVNRPGDARDNSRIFYYALRAVTRGEFTLPAVVAEAMYDPALRSVHGGGTIRIIAP